MYRAITLPCPRIGLIFAEPGGSQGINPRGRAKSIPDFRSASIGNSPSASRTRTPNSNLQPRSVGASPTGKSVRSGPVTFRLEQHQQQLTRSGAHRNGQVCNTTTNGRNNSRGIPSAGPLFDACRAVVCSSNAGKQPTNNAPIIGEDRAAAGPRPAPCVRSTSMSIPGSAPLQVLGTTEFLLV